jgi:hypothetical protein
MVYSLLERRNGHMKEWNKDTYQSIRERKIRAHKVCNREREREREREEHQNFGVIYSHCGLSSQFWVLADIS